MADRNAVSFSIHYSKYIKVYQKLIHFAHSNIVTQTPINSVQQRVLIHSTAWSWPQVQQDNFAESLKWFWLSAVLACNLHSVACLCLWHSTCFNLEHNFTRGCQLFLTLRHNCSVEALATDRSSSDPFSRSHGLFAWRYWLPSEEILSTL